MKRGRNEAKLIGIGRAPVAEGLVAEAHGLLERWEVVDPGLELIQHLGQGDDLRVYIPKRSKETLYTMWYTVYISFKSDWMCTMRT